jgi:hypothetical protein
MQPAKTSLDRTGQTAQASQAYVLELNTLGELFDAPDPDPFKTRVMDVLGIAGIDELQKRVQRTWPRAPGFDRIVLALPANQVSPDAAAQAQTAIDRYCDAQLEKNKLLYRQSMRVSKRQLAISLIILAFDLVLLWWISALTITGLPAILLGIFAIVCVYAFALAIWDAVENLFFARGPFMQDNAVYKTIRAMRVSVVAR